MIILKILSRKIVWNTSYRMMDQGCCAVVLAQHLGQNSRFAQKPPRGWLRAAQHAILGAQHFSPQAFFFVHVLFSFFAGEKKIGALFF